MIRSRRPSPPRRASRARSTSTRWRRRFAHRDLGPSARGVGPSPRPGPVRPCTRARLHGWTHGHRKLERAAHDVSTRLRAPAAGVDNELCAAERRRGGDERAGALPGAQGTADERMSCRTAPIGTAARGEVAA
eukprot:7380335-Prymnesium_polylepis.2